MNIGLSTSEPRVGRRYLMFIAFASVAGCLLSGILVFAPPANLATKPTPAASVTVLVAST